jgi:hypothetical protein
VGAYRLTQIDQKAAIDAQVAVGWLRLEAHLATARGDHVADLKTSPSPIFRLLRELRDELED